VVGAANGVMIGPAFRNINVKVGGNIAVSNLGHGFVANTDGVSHVLDNRAIGTGDAGFVVQAVGAVLERNTALNCLTGFELAIGSRLIDNVASQSRGAGFSLFDLGGFRLNYVVEGNSAIGNIGAGFELGHEPISNLPASVSSFRHNNAIGNAGPGILVFQVVNVSNFSRNNIYGNSISGGNPNCGIWNQSGSKLNAAGNFWGAATGPGADPADAAGGACDQNGSVTSFKPFATQFIP
jgi:hypothetical protein